MGYGGAAPSPSWFSGGGEGVFGMFGDTGLLGHLDPSLAMLVLVGIAVLCHQGVIPVPAALRNMDFWQGMMLWNIVQPLIFGRRGRRGGFGGFGGFGGYGGG